MSASVFHFENIEVYRRALVFSKTIYAITHSWPKEHLFGLTDQLRRASLSISLNIAEGSSRTHKDFRHFIAIAKGSCFECVPLIHLASSLQLIDNHKQEELYLELTSLSQMLSSLGRSLQ